MLYNLKFQNIQRKTKTNVGIKLHLNNDCIYTFICTFGHFVFFNTVRRMANKISLWYKTKVLELRQNKQQTSLKMLSLPGEPTF